MRPIQRSSALGALAALVFATSCDSFLDPSPSDVLTPENFYHTSSDAVAATNAVYESTKWSYWLGFWYISDIATDDIMAGPRVRPGGHPSSGYIFKSTPRPTGGVWGRACLENKPGKHAVQRAAAQTVEPTR